MDHDLFIANHIYIYIYNILDVYIYLIHGILWIKYIYLIYIYYYYYYYSSILDIEHSPYYIELGSPQTHKAI